MKAGVVRTLVASALGTLWIGVGPCGAELFWQRSHTTGIVPAAVTAGAVFDASLGAPACNGTGSGCDSGTLLVGRGPLGPEPNAPNTLGGSCEDGESGSFHSDESLDSLVLATTDGSLMRPGQEVTASVTVWAFGYVDVLDLYYATDASAPEWSLVGTVAVPDPGAQVLDLTFALAPGAQRQAIRGVFRYGSSALSPTDPACTVGAFDDHDDLVFTVGPADPGVATYDTDLRTPRCLDFGALCDSTSLLTGRGLTGPEPHQPNTTEDSCADGLSGVFHADSSLDRLRLSTATGVIAQGQTVQLDMTVFASTDYAGEHVDLFESDDASMPDGWRYLGTVAPTAAGAQTLSFPYAVGAGPINRSLRASYRSSLPVGGDACVVDPWVDHDDLWFRVDSAPGAHALAVDGHVTGGGGGVIELQSSGGPTLASCPVAPDGPPWPSGCALEVPEDAEILLTPVPQPDARFAGWTGACSGTDPCSLVMSEARQVGATFAAADTLHIDDTSATEDGAMTFTVTLSRVDP